MPYFNDVDTDSEDFLSPTNNPSMQTQANSAIDAEDNRSVLENVALFVPAVMAKTVDTFVSSMPGVDEEYMGEVIARNMPNISDYIQDNPNAVGITSDILGSFVPAGLAIKAVRTGSSLNKLATRTFGDGANKFFSTGMPNSKLFRPEFREARRIMKTRTGTHDISTLSTPEFAGMKRKAIFTSVKDVLIESAAADAAIYATMNSSEFLFPEEMTFADHMVFFGGVNTVFGVGAGLHAKYTMSRGINELARRSKNKSANPNQVPVQAASFADNRGAAVVGWQMMAEQFRDLLKVAPEETAPEAITTLKANITAAQGRLAEEFTNAASDNTIKSVSNKLQLDGNHLATLQGVAEQPANLTAFDGLRSLEALDNTVDWNNQLARKIARDEIELGRKKEKVAKLVNLPDSKSRKQLEKEIGELEVSLADDRQTSAIVYEIDNTVNGSTMRKELFQDGERKIATAPDGDKTIMLDEGQFIFNKKGGTQLPSTIVSDIPTASGKLPVSSDEVMGSLKVSPKGLTQQMRSPTGGAGIDLTPELLKLRNHFPETFTVYMRNGDDGVMSLTKRGDYNKPFTANREDVYGLRADNKLIGSLSKQSNLSSGTFTKLPFYSMTAIHDGQQAAREAINLETMGTLKVAPDMHHTQLDFVHGLLVDPKKGQAVQGKLDTTAFKDVAPNSDNAEFIQWQSLRSKFEDFQRIQNRRIAEVGLDDLSPTDYSRMLNLPANDDRIVQLFQMNRTSTDVVDLHHLFENVGGFKEMLRSMDDIPDTASPINLTGAMNRMPRDRKPVVGLTRTTDMPSGVISREHLTDQMLRTRDTQVTTMRESARPDSAGRRSLVVAHVASTFDKNAGLVQTIKQDAASLTGGTEAGGAISKVIGTQMFNNRMQSATVAMSRLTELTDKLVQKEVIDNVIIGATKESFQALAKRGNEGDYAAWASGFNALRAGWHVKPGAIEHRQFPGTSAVGDLPGRQNKQFVLEQNAVNKELWRARYGEEMPSNALVPISKVDKRPVTVTQVAYNGLKSVDNIQQQILTEENVLLASQNKPGIARKTWHMPVPNLEGKSMTYIMDMNDNILQAVPGATPRESRSLAQRAAGQYKQEVHVIGEDSVAAHSRAKGRTFQDITDVSSPLKQDAQSKGALSSPIITTDPRELKGVVDGMIADLAGIARRTRIELVKPELNLAEFQKVASGVGRDIGKTKSDTVWDNFRLEALGVQRIDDTSIVGKGLLAIEGGYDRAMQRWYDMRYTGKAQTHPLAQHLAKKQYEDFNDKILPEFNPFKDFNEYLEKTAQVTLPQTMRKNAGALNEVVTATAIRIFDVGMGVINTLSLAVTLPPVISQLARQAGESSDQHLKRVGAYGDVTPGGLTKLNPIKTAISATHWMWNDEGAQVLRKVAESKGYFDQFAAEQVKLYGRTGEDFIAGQLRNFADATSIITDKTETFARSYSFMNFAYVGKKVLELDDEAAAAFAHFQANNVIADFRPSNRPLMFQGAAGMPIGLFTTYMWNYLQRMYSMIESRQMPALINQVGLQSAFFGAESVPGVQGFIDTFTSNYDGSSNLVDRMNASLGHDATEWMLNGSIASMTGISFGPRASVGIPGTRMNPINSNFYLEAAPATSMISKAAGVVKGSWDNIMETGEFNPGYAAQLFARSNLNKGTANVIELAQGFSEDINGNLIEGDTRTQAGVIARTFGMKPLYADEFRQENRRNTATDAKRNELKDRLAANLQTHARRGTLTGEVVEDALGSYVKAGGDPERFRRFYKSQIVKGTQTKLDREIAESLKQSHDQNRIARLLAIMES